MHNLISLIYRAIQSEYEAIQIYKEVANSSNELGKPEIADIFHEIARDEMVHVGNLEELLKTFLPEDYIELKEKSEEGHQETLKDLEEVNTTSILEKALIESDCKYTIENTNDYIEYHIVKSSFDNPLKVYNSLKRKLNNTDTAIYTEEEIIISCRK